MNAVIVGAVVFGLWLLILLFVCAFCRMAAPSDPLERQIDDDSQIEFLRKYRAR